MHLEIDGYLRFLSSDTNSSQNTVAAYRNDLGQFRQFLIESNNARLGRLGGMAVDASGDTVDGWGMVTRTRIAAFMVHLREKGYAPTTIARKMAATKSFFHYLVAERIIGSDPTENLDSPKVDKALPHSLAQGEVVELLRSSAKGAGRPDTLRNSAMLNLLWATGVRVSELVALDVDDLNLSAGYVRCVGKAGRERLIPLTLEAQAALQEYLEAGRQALIKQRDETSLFVNHRGDRLTRQGLWLILKGRAKEAGLDPDVTPQALRHSFALHQLDQHTDLRSLQELLGHASISTTQVYAQLAGARGRQPSRPNGDAQAPSAVQ